MWILFGFLSMVFLSGYEIFKKRSLDANAVIPVLFFATLSSALIFVPLIVVSYLFPQFAAGHFWYVPSVGLQAHAAFAIKSVIVGIAWIFASFALRYLPLTVVAPINATAPLWTLLGAILIYNERLTSMQWIGVSIAIIFYFWFMTGGKLAGKSFTTNRWVIFSFLSVLFNSISALYDKFLVKHYPRTSMQAYFCIYLSIIYLLMYYFLYYRKRQTHTNTFQWRNTIILIGIFLVIADFFYFYALTFEGSLVSILILIRRINAVIVFIIGAIWFNESNIRYRAIALAGIFSGVILILFGT